MPVQIPLAALPPKPAGVTEQIGFIYCYETTIPVVLCRTPEGVTIRQNEGHDNLGSELSVTISRKQFEKLLKKETVTL